MKYTVITGASSGIGYAAAIEYARKGNNLIIVARRQQELERLKKAVLEINSQLDVVIKVSDLSILENVYALYESLTDFEIGTWINNAGFGNFQAVGEQDLTKINKMLQLNIQALTVLSTLYARDYEQVDGAVLINVSSAGGYTIIEDAITYCATKFYVSAFTEGMAQELVSRKAKLQAKVLAPAATETEFAVRSRKDLKDFDYNVLPKFHTSEEMAKFLIQLHESDSIVGIVNGVTYEFSLSKPIFPYASRSQTFNDSK